ncbi:MAG: hypothetical protein AAGD86_04470 [Pseudomonadota bacterium]
MSDDDKTADDTAPEPGHQRERLRDIQRELVQVDEDAGPRESPPDLNKLLGDVLASKQQRKHQLKAIKEFFDDPSKFGVDADEVPHSSTREEILERHAELSYRTSLLRSVLKVLRREAANLDAGRDGD